MLLPSMTQVYRCSEVKKEKKKKCGALDANVQTAGENSRRLEIDARYSLTKSSTIFCGKSERLLVMIRLLMPNI